MSTSNGAATAHDATVEAGGPDPRSAVEIARDEADLAEDTVARLERKRDKAKAHLADAEQAVKEAKTNQKDAAKRLKDAEKGDE